MDCITGGKQLFGKKSGLVKQIRLTFTRFPTLRTAFSVTLALLYGPSDWKQALYI